MKTGEIFVKFQMFNIIWFQTTWERKLGSKTDNLFRLERKQVKLEIEAFVIAQLFDCA